MVALFPLWAALVLLGFNTITVIADGSCVPTCVNNVQNEHYKDLGCVDANQAGCLCEKQGFVDLIAECSKTCGATVEEIRQGMVGADPPRFCVGEVAKVPAARVDGSPSPAPPSPSLTSTSSPAASTPPVSTSSTPSPSPTPSPSSALTSPSLTPTSASPSASSTSTTPGTPIASTTSSSGSALSTHSSTSTTTAGETSPASSPVPASGISSGAAAGIGIGVAIVVAAVAVIAFCLLRNRKKQAGPRHSLEISKPLPGSGLTYPARDDRDRTRDSYDRYGGNDIEMTSNRYEDMVPSQQPRTMV